MKLDLQGKVAVVTGASKGIGLAVVEALHHEGVRVVAGARHSSPELDELARTGSVTVVTGDLSTSGGPAALVAAAGDQIDILVNNVGAVQLRLEGFLAITDAQWNDSMNLNFMAAVRATRAVLPSMLAAGRGSIVTVSSVNAFLPDPGIPDYGAAKAALSNFSKALSKEVGRQGIRVNTVSPGPVTTGLWLGDDGVASTISKASGTPPDAVAQQAVSDSATGRFTTAGEVADLVVLLASDKMDNVTGADFTIDGGLVQTL